MGHEGHDHDHGPHGHHHHHPEHHAPHEHASPAAEHKAHAPAQVATYLITCSDTRDERSDASGRTLRQLLEGAGHPLAGQEVVRDEADSIRGAIAHALEAGARAIILSGGTGIGRRDCTIETLRPMLDKELPGFGELFRSLSFGEIGSAAMMSRAIAGTHQGAIVFALPGSPAAARLAMERLILPELGHAVRELTK